MGGDVGGGRYEDDWVLWEWECGVLYFYYYEYGMLDCMGEG